MRETAKDENSDKFVAILTAILSPQPERLATYSTIIEKLAPQLAPAARKSQHWSRISDKRGLLLSVIGGRQHVNIRGYSVLAGVTSNSDTENEWGKVGGAIPDGSFVAMRSSASALEIVTDYTGSGSVWYCRLACGAVVASTSFELIIALLGNFCVDQKSFGWFLSSGTTGPRRSWDERIKPMSRNAVLRAERSGANVSVREASIDQPRFRTARADVESLRAVVMETFENISFGNKPWLLALSGGYDSRAMLDGTRHLEDVTCVTWVDEQMLNVAGSDLDVARRLAAIAGREHRVLEIQRPRDASALDAAARRFVRYCDGRVDNVFAYLDGMQIWDDLAECRAGGLLRGDELFGSTYAVQESQVLHNMRLSSFADYARSEPQRSLHRRYAHELPVGLLRRPRESVAHWRWRLRASFELPTVYAALNAIRARFFQCSCPLLSRRIVDFAGALPSVDHNDRVLYKKMVEHMYPNVPIATAPSVVNRSGFLRLPPVTEILLDHLSGEFAQRAVGRRVAMEAAQSVAMLRKAAAGSKEQDFLPSRKRAYVPTWAKRTKKNLAPKPALDLPTLAMRSYLAEIAEQELKRAAADGNRSRECVAQAIA